MSDDAEKIDAAMRVATEVHVTKMMLEDEIGTAIEDVDEEMLNDFHDELRKAGIEPNDELDQQFCKWADDNKLDAENLFAEYVREEYARLSGATSDTSGRG